MKLKLSSLLLIGLALLIISGILASGFILRKKYDKLNTEDRFWYYKKLTNKPFKHIKIEQIPDISDTIADNMGGIPAIFGTLTFEGGSNYSVVSSPISYSSRQFSNKKDTLICKTEGDTLYIRVPPNETFYSTENGRVSFDLRLNAPHLESITCLNVSPDMIGFIQNKLNIALIGHSILTFVKNHNEMILIKAMLQDKAVLKLSPYLKIDTLDVNLKDHSKLQMPVLAVENLNLQTADSTSITAPSRLFKKGIEK